MVTKLQKFIYIAFLKFLWNFGSDDGNSSMLTFIKSDFYRCTASVDINDLFEFVLIDPGFEFVFFLRFASLKPKSFFHKRVHAFSYYFHKKLFYKYGYQIPINTKIGKGFQILHFGSIIFNPIAKIGDNCTVFPGVTIGQDRKGHAPTIGNNVFIGSNSIIVGGIQIGSNCLIAPGSYVNFNVPDNSLVIGNPGKFFIKNEKIISGYLNNLV